MEEIHPLDGKLRAWLRSRFSSLPDIDDLVQEAYIRVLRAHETGPIANAKAFLFITARNLALNQIRQHRRERTDGFTENDASFVFDDKADIHTSLARAEALNFLITAIQSLPERCRQIMTLRKIYGLSQKEVAAKLGISENTVETQGQIGLRKCMEYFRQHGYGPDPRP